MRDSVRVILGLVGAIIAISVLILLVGFEEFTEALFESNTVYVLISGMCAVLWLMSWSGTFYVVSRSLDLDLSYISCFRTYSTVMFANNVTPFAHLGGEPLAAGFVTKVVDKNYEKCLGALSSVSVVHFVPSVIFFTLGSVYFGITGAELPNGLRWMVGAFLLLTVVIVSLAISVYAFRSKTQNIIIELLTVCFSVGGKIPKVPQYGRDKIEKLVDGYLSTFSDVADDKKTVALSVILSTTGVMFQALGLWFALDAVGLDISIFVPIIAFPIAGLASALPLPGGAGGIDAVLIAMVVAFSSAIVVDVSAAVVIIRTFIYWIPVIIGTLNLGIVTAKSSDE